MGTFTTAGVSMNLVKIVTVKTGQIIIGLCIITALVVAGIGGKLMGWEENK